MERFDIEQQAAVGADQPARVRTPLTSPRTRKFIMGHDSGGGQLISLRKYSAAICLVEALAIMLLVYLLLRLPSAHEQQRLLAFSQGQVSDSLAPPYRTYSDHLNSARLLLGLVRNCSQRRHDLAHSSQCQGHLAPGACTPVEQQQQASITNPGHLGKTRLQIIETTRSGARLAHRYAPLVVTQGAAAESATSRTRMVIHRERQHQRIIGWGGALTDSTINNVLSLTTNATRNLLDDYFGPSGLRFNLARITIGGSDFSSRFYTNDDLPPPPPPSSNTSAASEAARDGDWSLSNFRLMEEDRLYKLPMLRHIQSEYFGHEPQDRGGLKVFASMWSPPVWLKDNAHFNKGHLRGAINDEPVGASSAPPVAAAAAPTSPGASLSSNSTGGLAFGPEAAFAALAQLKIKFLEAYRAAGVELWGLTVMNEPVFAVQPFLNFNTMIFPREDYANYVAKYLGPQVKRHPHLGHLKLMLHDDNRRFLDNFTRPMLEQTRVRQFVDGVSVHGYIDEEYGQMARMYEQFHDQSKTSDDNDDFFILPTELCSGHLPFMEKALAGNWHRGVHYALDIIRSLQAQAAGWVDWNMVLDMEGGPGWLGGRLDAPVLVDKTRDTYHRSPMFYVLGHFSRYIPPGSRRLELELSNATYDAHYEVVCFETPAGQLVLVVVNNNPYPVTLHWRLSSGAAGGMADFYVTTSPAESVQTLILSEK